MNDERNGFNEPVEPIELPEKKKDSSAEKEKPDIAANTDGNLPPVFFDEAFSDGDADNKSDNSSEGVVESVVEDVDLPNTTAKLASTKKVDKIDKSIKAVKKTKKVVGASLKTVGYVVKKSLSLLMIILLTILIVGIITGIVVGAVFFKYIVNNVDGSIDISGIAFTLEQSTSIYYVDERGNQIEIEEEKLHGSENRTWAPYSAIPQQLSNAFIAIEDKRFRSHNGVDIKRSLKAFVYFFLPTSESAGGGSTITQQLIKNITKEDDVKIQRKVQEMLRALNLEKQYDKNEILEMYLNTIYLSQNSYGVQTAAKAYFGKELSELSLVECAALAAIPKSPTKYDPIRNPDENLKRRRSVLTLMHEQGMITLEQFNEAYKIEELTFAREAEETNTVIHSYYVDAVIDNVIKDLSEKYGYSSEIASRVLYSGGLKIVTAMDPFVQETIDSVFSRTDHRFLDNASGILPQASMVIVDPESGAVLGLAGSLGEKTANRSLNRATQSRRQCGSSIKPLTAYGPALDKGLITYGTVLDDTPYETFTAKNSPTGKPRAWPTNAAGGFRGLVTMNYAVNKSLNTIPVKLVDMLGVENSFKFLTEDLEFSSVVERVVTQSGDVLSDKGLAPLALGGFTYGVTTMEMAAGFTMFANRGIYSSPMLYHQVLDNQNVVILSQTENKKIVIKESTAYIMTKMLQNALVDGTGRYLTLGKKSAGTPMVDVAGKTGSTNDDRDRYFVGYTPYYVGACWFGYDSNKSLAGFNTTTAGTNNPALTLWDYVMIKLHQNIEKTNGGMFRSFSRPSNIVEVEYCIDSGKLPSEACSHDPRGKRTDIGYFELGTEPREECDTHVLVWWDTKNKAVASASTPEANLKKIALINVPDRSFEVRVFVIDAQYVYRDIPSNYKFPTTNGVPYFQNLIPKGTYVGETYPESGKHPVNSFSYQTYKKDEMPDANWFVIKPKEPEVSEPEISEPEESGEVSQPEVSGLDTSEPLTSGPEESEIVIIIPPLS